MFLSQARSQVSAWLSWSGVPPSLALVSNLEWEGAPRVSGSSAGGGRRYGKGRDQHGHSASLGSLPLPSRSEGVEGWDQTCRSAPGPSCAAGLPWPSRVSRSSALRRWPHSSHLLTHAHFGRTSPAAACRTWLQSVSPAAPRRRQCRHRARPRLPWDAPGLAGWAG